MCARLGRKAQSALRPLSRPSPSANLVGDWKGNPPEALFALSAIPKKNRQLTVPLGAQVTLLAVNCVEDERKR